jgi:hypothetical protein
MAKTVILNPINPVTFEFQDYSNQDDNLIVNFQLSLFLILYKTM